MTEERIAKRLANAGICSRREAERWIEDGRVAVNGKVLKTPAFTVGAEDTIAVDGKVVGAKPATQLWRYHKTAGLVTTERDPEGRPTVFQRFPKQIGRVLTVGRLDLNTEGLLLLTNDGALKRKLELPSNGWVRRYRVRVHGAATEAKLKKLADGLTIDGEKYGAIAATLDREQGSNAWVTVSLAEGKNREVRKAMEAIDLTVTRLIRIAYGPFQLGTLPKGAVEEVSGKVMREQLGIGAAKDA